MYYICIYIYNIYIYIYKIYFASVRFSAICVLWTTYEHLHEGPCLACGALFGSLIPECVTVHHVPNCISLQRAIYISET